MAKGKRAAALFEVIQAAKEREQLRAKGGGFLTPSWWFKGKAANGNSAPAPAQTSPPPKAVARPKNVLPPTPAPIIDEPDDTDSESATHSPADSSADSSPYSPSGETVASTSEESLSGTFSPEPSPPPVHHDFVDNEEPALDDPRPAAPPREPKPSTPARPLRRPLTRTPVNVGVDKNRQQVVLRLSFTSAAISTFGLIVVIALAVLIGKSLSKGPAPAGAASIADVKNGKANPSVMTVFQGKNGGDETPIAVAQVHKPTLQAVPTPPQPKSSGNNKSPETAKESSSQSGAQKQPQPAGPPAPGKRIIGEQYVLIQSYPDPEDANDARDALIKAGIDCTCEKNTRWAPKWTCVIGTRGFDHTKDNNEFKAYMASIQQVGNVFAGPSKFRQFQPQVIGWKE